MGDPIKSHMRILGLTKLLSIYGGMLVPKTFACKRSLISMYNGGIQNSSMFACEDVSNSVISNKLVYYPNTYFMGCSSKSQSMMKLNASIAEIISKDYTDELEFTGKINQECYKMALSGEINIICGSKVGIKKQDNSELMLQDLFEEKQVQLSPTTYGLYIPENKILKSMHYGYFPRFSVKQVSESRMFICRVLAAL